MKRLIIKQVDTSDRFDRRPASSRPLSSVDEGSSVGRSIEPGRKCTASEPDRHTLSKHPGICIQCNHASFNSGWKNSCSLYTATDFTARGCARGCQYTCMAAICHGNEYSFQTSGGSCIGHVGLRTAPPADIPIVIYVKQNRLRP
jgi:hypothetical protein